MFFTDSSTMLVETPMKSHHTLSATPGGAVGVSQARCQSGVAHRQQLEGGAEGALDLGEFMGGPRW